MSDPCITQIASRKTNAFRKRLKSYEYLKYLFFKHKPILTLKSSIKKRGSNEKKLCRNSFLCTN